MQIVDKQTNTEIEKSTDRYIINFGILKKNQIAKRTVQIKGNNLEGLTSQSDCSCTESSPEVIDKNTIEIELQYKNTHITKPFDKKVYLNFHEDKQPKVATINIKGQVTL